MFVPFSAEAMSVFKQSLLLMIQGMTGIFVFMTIFYGLIKLLNHLFSPKVKEEQ
jgi:Na+-transporting methylmalonyl-CoA/oxaloacetate decarboxylase gamma subunit